MTARERFAAVVAVLRRPDTIFLILLLIVAVVAYVAENRPDDGSGLDSYSTYDRHSGGYRVWLDLVRAERLSGTTFERHAILLDHDLRTLVYAEPLPQDPRGVVPGRSDVADLERWVRDGGRLLYLGYDDGAAREGTLGLPGTVPPTPAPKGPASPTPAPHSIGGALTGPADRDAFQKRFDRYAVACGCVVGGLTIAPELRALGVVHVLPHAKRRLFAPLRRPFAVLLGDERGALAVRYSLGKGSVTELVDETLFSNGRIGEGDDARLAYALSAPGPVAFDEVPHGYSIPEQWYDVVPRPFTIAIGIAIAVLLVAIGGAAFRLGPPVVPFDREPTSVEFIDSLAGLFQRNRAARAALDDAIVSVRRTVATSLGLLAAAPLDEVMERIRNAEDRTAFAELLGLANAEKISDVTLVRGLALAQRLRKDYAHGRPRN